MRYLIGLDIGTSSVKGVLMTTEGFVKAKAHEKFLYDRQDNGILEIPADRYLTACYDAINTLVKSLDNCEILGICASSASGNVVVLDKDYNPLTKVINWQDKRVGEEAEELLKNTDFKELYKKVGWAFDGKSFPLAQLCYMKKRQPQLLNDCRFVCMSTEYLYYKLTGNWGISSSAGTPFYLIDQMKGEYIPEILDVLGLDETKLPPIMNCGKVLGHTTEKICKETGIPAGIPVVLGSFDHPSAARGVGVLEEGQMLLSCGTSWVGFLPVKSREKLIEAGTLIDPFLSPDGPWATMTSLASLSERIKIYVDKYIDNSDNAFNLFAKLAAESKSGAGGLKINPLDEPDDVKILKYHKSHIARAIMEGTVHLLKARLEELAQMGISANSAVMVGGPSENPMWIKIIEEICGIPVKVIHGAVAGAVGAAVIAGMGTGVYMDERHASNVLKSNIQE